MPLIRTSSRKFAFVTAIPTWPLVRSASVLLTVLSPLTSPMSILALTEVGGSTCDEASVTPVKVTVSVWTSVTFVSGTVMVMPEKVGVPTVPVPELTLALPLTTLVVKLNTRL